MKISKLTIAALLTMGLVVTGCNNKKPSSSSVEPSSSSEPAPAVVERIRVTPLNRTLVVGDQINLDDYVTVVGGDGGEKAFTAAVTAGADVVSIEGKTVTAIGEGDFTITLSAGTKTALFSGSSLTALKAAFKDWIDTFPSEVYGVQVQTYNAGGEIVDKEGAVIVHQEDYFGHFAWSSSAPKVGGYLKSGDGNMYKWSSEDMNGTNFKAIPGPIAPVANWSLYFINTALYFNFADFAMTDYDEGVKLLAITDEAGPQADLTEYFNCAIDQLMYCGLGYDFEDDIDKTLFVHAKEKAEGGFDFSFELIYTDVNGTPDNPSDDETRGFPFRFLLGEAAPKLQFVQDYVDSGEHPEPISFAEYTTLANSAITAKNYSYAITVGWFSSKTFAYYDPSLTPQILAALGIKDGDIDSYANDRFYSLTEQGVVTATGRHSSITEYVFENKAIASTPTSEFGLIDHDSKVYSFSKNGGLEDYATQEVSGATSLWESLPNRVGAGLVPNAQFEVSSKTDNGDGSITFGFAQGSAGIGQLGSATANLGRYNYYSASQLQYMLGRLITTADSFTFTFGVNFGGGLMWGAKLQVSGIGSAVFPVAEDVIFPTA